MAQTKALRCNVEYSTFNIYTLTSTPVKICGKIAKVLQKTHKNRPAQPRCERHEWKGLKSRAV